MPLMPYSPSTSVELVTSPSDRLARLMAAASTWRTLACPQCAAHMGRYTDDSLDLGVMTTKRLFVGYCKQCGHTVRWIPLGLDKAPLSE
jgi:hypothetical protein